MNNKLINCFVSFALTISSVSIHANENSPQWTSQSRQLLTSLEDDVRNTLSLIAESQGGGLDQFRYSLELPEARNVNLGLILELNDSQTALDIISVLPGGLASAYGLVDGDEISSVDGIVVNVITEIEILRKLRYLKTGDRLLLMVGHQGGEREIAIPVSATFTPQVKLEIGYDMAKESPRAPGASRDSGACGEVSVELSPRENGGLSPASISSVDDDPGVANQTSFKLSVGKHTIFVNEHIENLPLGYSNGPEKNTKAIQINVRANTSYHLGAKSITSKFNVAPNGDYWEAVIWKTSQQECQL